MIVALSQIKIPTVKRVFLNGGELKTIDKERLVLDFSVGGEHLMIGFNEGLSLSFTEGR
jgi:hypothetical protein